jgi:hypothetical protein
VIFEIGSKDKIAPVIEAKIRNRAEIRARKK